MQISQGIVGTLAKQYHECKGRSGISESFCTAVGSGPSLVSNNYTPIRQIQQIQFLFSQCGANAGFVVLGEVDRVKSVLTAIIIQIIGCDLFKELMINRIWNRNYKVRAPCLIDSAIFNLNKRGKKCLHVLLEHAWAFSRFSLVSSHCPKTCLLGELISLNWS